MKTIHWLAAITAAGAALLFWRVGEAVVAEVRFDDARAVGTLYTVSTMIVFGLSALLPLLLSWSVFSYFRDLTDTKALRLALAAAVGIYSVTTALLRVAGIHFGGATASVPWFVMSFLAYHCLLKPAVLKMEHRR